MNLHGMYRWFDVVPNGFVVSHVFPFWWFSELFLAFFIVTIWRHFFEGLFLDVTYEDLVPLCLVTLLQQTLRNGFDLMVVGGVRGKVFLRVNFRFLLIGWIWGTELLAKGSPWGTPAIPKVSLESVERIGRSIKEKVEFFPRAEFFPIV
jgi:hypothetical protein